MLLIHKGKVMTQDTIDRFNIDDDLQEMRVMQQERQMRLLDALEAMENGLMSEEDKDVIWFETGMPRSAFRRIN
jgi:hypothetical protein